jgi:hypothetical protein
VFCSEKVPTRSLNESLSPSVRYRFEAQFRRTSLKKRRGPSTSPVHKACDGIEEFVHEYRKQASLEGIAASVEECGIVVHQL